MYSRPPTDRRIPRCSSGDGALGERLPPELRQVGKDVSLWNAPDPEDAPVLGRRVYALLVGLLNAFEIPEQYRAPVRQENAAREHHEIRPCRRVSGDDDRHAYREDVSAYSGAAQVVDRIALELPGLRQTPVVDGLDGEADMRVTPVDGRDFTGDLDELVAVVGNRVMREHLSGKNNCRGWNCRTVCGAIGRRQASKPSKTNDRR